MTLLTIAIAAMMVLAIILAALPKECICEHCAYHRHERSAAREAKRAADHVRRHELWPQVPWGDQRCAQCKLGFETDRPR